MTATLTLSTWRHVRHEYRHRQAQCSRLLFVGYLPPGTHIEMRCPSCGRMHVIDIPAAPPIDTAADRQIDTEQKSD